MALQELDFNVDLAGDLQFRGKPIPASHTKRLKKLWSSRLQGDYPDAGFRSELGGFRCARRCFPQSWFECLQRLQARVKLGLKPTSLEADGIIDPSEDSAVDYCLEAGIETHLLCHTPTGYFIPGKWDGPPLFDDDGVLPGSYVGSSAKLLDELVELSPALGVNFRSLSGRLRLAGGFDLTEESIDSLNADCIASLPSSFRASREESKGEDKQAKTVSSGLQSTPIGASGKPVHVLYRERQVWFALYEGAKQSLKQNTALVLH